MIRLSARHITRISLLVLTASVLFGVGLQRDAFFIYMNRVIDHLAHAIRQPDLPSQVQSLFVFLHQAFWYSKWLFTLLFSGIYWLLGLGIVYFVFYQVRYLYIMTILYLALGLLAFFSVMTGLIFNDYAFGYTIARKIMGMVQSPVLVLLLIPAFKLIPLKQQTT